MRRVLSSLLLGPTLLAVSACGGGTPTDSKADKLDERLLGKGNADPVLTAALEDQIMVDPSLANMANRNAVRAPDAPMTAPVPPETTGPSAAAERPDSPTLGQIARRQATAARDRFNGCGLDVDYAMGWANRLPADVPLYPRARVEEAAGSDMQGCKLRAVTFTTQAPARAVIDFYIGQTKRSGFASSTEVKGRETLVGGTRSDGAAYYVVVTPAEAGGTIVDLVLNNGV